MTYALAWPLQQALYELFRDDPACAVHFGSRIYDAPPPLEAAEANDLFLLIGDEDVEDWSTATERGATHLVSLAIHAPRRGFSAAKQAAAAVSDALLGVGPVPARGRVVNLRFVDARTKRAEKDALRQVVLRFRVTLEDTQ